VARDASIVAGDGIATLRLGASTPLRVVDAILSGTHDPGTSHFELLRAFAADAALARMSEALERGRFRTHEFGDSILIERSRDAFPRTMSPYELLRGLV
jgi:S-adenosylmethionine:tRNA ribosyltransferase-isomerase